MALIYNEGRVAGYSAYETYVKQFLLVNPEGTPATEREWLASSLAMGSSILLKVPKTPLGEVVVVQSIGANVHVDIELDITKTLTGIYINPNLPDNTLENIIFTANSGTENPTYYTAKEIIEDDNNAILSFIEAGSLTIQNNTSGTIFSGSILIEYNLFGDDIYHYVDIPLPTNTSLCAANTIIGTWVDITPKDTNNEIDGIASYSNYAIPNTPIYHPNLGKIQATDLPTNPIIHYDVPITNINQANEYSKIVDGVVLQSGTWTRTDETTPYAMFSNPEFDNPPLVRLIVKGTIEYDFYILLTGFSDSGIVSGVTGLDGAWDTAHPQSGDFMGPAIYPWANKIVFVNNSIIEYAIIESAINIISTIPPFKPNTYYRLNNTNYELIPSKPTDWDVIDTQLASDTSYINCYVKQASGDYIKTPPILATGVKYINKYNTNMMLLPITSVDANPQDVLDENTYNDGSGYITWSQLFRALAGDKRIRVSPHFVDTLQSKIKWNSETTSFEFESDTGLKVGKNYIDFNGIRLYISNIEPAQTYTPLQIEPTDWSTTYTNYYRYDSGTDTYTQITDTTAPQFIANTFYSADIPNGSIGIGW